MLIGLQTFACTSPLILQARDLGVEERKTFVSVIHSILARIHSLSTERSTFALVVYFPFGSVGKMLHFIECLAI